MVETFNYKKASDILGALYDSAQDLGDDFLPHDFWITFEDALSFAGFVSAGWAKPTEQGIDAIRVAWNFLCAIRELDPDIVHDSIIDFFKAQAEDAEVIPIERGRNNG